MRFESPPCLSRRLRLRLRLLFPVQQLPPVLTAAAGFILCWRGPQPTRLIAGSPEKVGKKLSGFGLQEYNDFCSLHIIGWSPCARAHAVECLARQD